MHDAESRGVGDLFVRHPVQFGLRGDLYLWEALRTGLSGTPMPSSWFELRRILFDAVERVIGRPLNPHVDPGPVYVADFDPGHGMSAGQVQPAWWVNTGIPILLDRFEAARERADPPGDRSGQPTGPAI